MMTKKKVPKKINITNSQDLCGHIHTLYANAEILKELFPMYFGSDTNNENETDENETHCTHEPLVENTEDVSLQQHQVCFF